jgi:hypothetical protein
VNWTQGDDQCLFRGISTIGEVGNGCKGRLKQYGEDWSRYVGNGGLVSRILGLNGNCWFSCMEYSWWLQDNGFLVPIAAKPGLRSWIGYWDSSFLCLARRFLNHTCMNKIWGNVRIFQQVIYIQRVITEISNTWHDNRPINKLYNIYCTKYSYRCILIVSTYEILKQIFYYGLSSRLKPIVMLTTATNIEHQSMYKQNMRLNVNYYSYYLLFVYQNEL